MSLRIAERTFLRTGQLVCMMLYLRLQPRGPERWLSCLHLNAQVFNLWNRLCSIVQLQRDNFDLAWPLRDKTESYWTCVALERQDRVILNLCGPSETKRSCIKRQCIVVLHRPIHRVPSPRCLFVPQLILSVEIEMSSSLV